MTVYFPYYWIVLTIEEKLQILIEAIHYLFWTNLWVVLARTNFTDCLYVCDSCVKNMVWEIW